MVGDRPLRGFRRVAYECGYRWGLVNALSAPAVPPDRDVVTLQLTEAEARAALELEPDEWWHHWANGWVAGLTRAHERFGDG